MENNSEYIFCLYITGASPHSMRAISNLKEICKKYLEGKYSLEIIDVYKDPLKAKQEQLIALPLLVKKFPFPERRLIGDLSDAEKVLKMLGLDV